MSTKLLKVVGSVEMRYDEKASSEMTCSVLVGIYGIGAIGKGIFGLVGLVRVWTD
ncbi:hypothetical protein L873DRAFT_302478 [Choiromyces venosus 120613-1]|uniref:Uncharacterized protein n=1 Tax=Choiromyces venosus 120613-1 TaxID=1336337 RepID=A0A3N4J345_9PEZI|nr:hypothetical protein L873DRAFT_302478 [Choiromyces venosus 120613-1]